MSRRGFALVIGAELAIAGAFFLGVEVSPTPAPKLHAGIPGVACGSAGGYDFCAPPGFLIAPDTAAVRKAMQP